ncbi:TPR-containing protein DDB_G0280363 isoform X2 [Drosophila serrata]|uniref:TPR-containing protein DDB_G0280363 isoform X2 n=1 Tax=Drosophila serrata TaxID=7274 RepID=UPI000A1CFE03|nr:TPR-containing protein DDB_G0280363 isoform X2 [Drosophila serrata]
MSSTSSSVLTLSSFNLLFFTQVLTVLSSTIKYNEYATDKGNNVSIPCIAQGNIMWVKEHGNNSTIVQTGRVLVLRNVSPSDGGIYVCFASLPRPSSTAATATSATTAIARSSPATSATTSPQQAQDRDEENEDRESSKDTEQAEQEEVEYLAYQRTKLTVRTVPGPVTQLYFKASTILGFLIWRFNKTQSGGYPVRSFTAEFRNVSYSTPPANASFEHAWSRMDPINIAPNVRQMEVYRLAPNTTYEFRIWANNELGSGEVVTTNVTTLPETKEEELQDGWDSIELIPNIILNPGFSESDGGAGGDEAGEDADDEELDDGEGEEGEDNVPLAFPRTIIFGTQHHRQPRSHLHPQQQQQQQQQLQLQQQQPRQQQQHQPRHHHLQPFHLQVQSHHHHHHRHRHDDDDDEDYEEEHEPTMERFKRKVSVFFTGPTIKRI